MRLKKVYIRFYKSFNFDYERRYTHTIADAAPWDLMEGSWYPFVRVALEPSITTVVGSNEAGKSHLLDAIEKLINGQPIERSAFCRYSQFFSVEEGKVRVPDLGGEFEVQATDLASLDKFFELKEGEGLDAGDTFHLFRINGGSPEIYLRWSKEPIVLKDAEAQQLPTLLPPAFRLRPDLPLPESIPLTELNEKARRSWGSRRHRGSLLDMLFGRQWAQETWNKSFGEFSPLVTNVAESGDDLVAQYELGRDLLFSVAKIDRDTFRELDEAIADENEGYVNGVIQRINDALAVHLNFPRWWAQDREFRLMVSPREHEISFTIRDRTGTDYSFKERSKGLTWFLSYFVQLRAHHSPVGTGSEILLMDEPDAFLSNQGQQDLLRILEDFARPEDRSREAQVIYVTHSPFLINRNAGHRIRVLDKGSTDEGTRVVQDASQNHYEPLRSSLGSFVAETAFIGGQNLFVEGLADQVLLAGMSTHLRAKDMPTLDLLDLNGVTIVPAGGAPNLPYLVYLARGRDEIRPPSVALLDSDAAGDEAVKTLGRIPPRGKRALAPEFIFQIGRWAAAKTIKASAGVTIVELEDLVPVELATVSARSYARRVLAVDAETVEHLVDADITSALAAADGSLFAAVSNAFRARFNENIEKVGFAKELMAYLEAARREGVEAPGMEDLESNFYKLEADLARALRRASNQEQERRQVGRLDRIVKRFLEDHPTAAAREYGRVLLEEVESVLEESAAGDRPRALVVDIRRTFKLDEDQTELIEDFEQFRLKIEGLRLRERLDTREEQTGSAVPLPSAALPEPAPTAAASRNGELAPSVEAPLPHDVEAATAAVVPGAGEGHGNATAESLDAPSS